MNLSKTKLSIILFNIVISPVERRTILALSIKVERYVVSSTCPLLYLDPNNLVYFSIPRPEHDLLQWEQTDFPGDG